MSPRKRIVDLGVEPDDRLPKQVESAARRLDLDELTGSLDERQCADVEILIEYARSAAERSAQARWTKSAKAAERDEKILQVIREYVTAGTPTRKIARDVQAQFTLSRSKAYKLIERIRSEKK